LGHLIVSAQGICEEMQVNNWLSSDWQTLYNQQSNPVNDPTIYHNKHELLSTLDDAVNRVEENFRSLSNKELNGPMPDTRYHHIFPTLSHVISRILIVHPVEHIKMLLMWRFFLLND
jgi:hypothetical protein